MVFFAPNGTFQAAQPKRHYLYPIPNPNPLNPHPTPKLRGVVPWRQRCLEGTIEGIYRNFPTISRGLFIDFAKFLQLWG